MWHTLIVFGLLVCVSGKNSDSGDSNNNDALINSVFKKSWKGDNNNDKYPITEPRLPSGQPGGNTDGACVCVPYYLCDNGFVNTNGRDLIDIRHGENNIDNRVKDGPCDSYLDVCCKKDDTQEKPTPPPLKKTGCGIRNPDGIGFRITGDNDHETQFGEFPWMVAILREETIEDNSMPLNVYQCGGALVHPQAVITAAHCVSNKQQRYKIRAGEWDTQTKNELYPYQDRDVESITIHPQYYAGALFNDIAVLILNYPVEIAENVDVVCLPAKNTVISGRCFVSGWGKDVFGNEGKYQVILKKIDLPIVPRAFCQTSLRTSRLGKLFQLHKSFICAGGEPGKDTCKGDGGSPLVCPIRGQKERYQQAGIVSWGIGCGDKNTPGVYVNVALFREWIDEQMRLHNLTATVDPR